MAARRLGQPSLQVNPIYVILFLPFIKLKTNYYATNKTLKYQTIKKRLKLKTTCDIYSYVNKEYFLNLLNKMKSTIKYNKLCMLRKKVLVFFSIMQVNFHYL